MTYHNRDDVGLETPSGFRRKADELRNSWGRLVESFPADKTLLGTAREFEDWHYKATKESSALAQMFGTSELEKWVRRYADEYARLTKANPKVETTAPKPETILPEESHLSPWFWPIAIGITGSAIIGSIWVLKRK